MFEPILQLLLWNNHISLVRSNISSSKVREQVVAFDRLNESYAIENEIPTTGERFNIISELGGTCTQLKFWHLTALTQLTRNSQLASDKFRPSAISKLDELINHTRISKRASISKFVQLLGGNFPQNPPHYFSTPRFWKSRCPMDSVRCCKSPYLKILQYLISEQISNNFTFLSMTVQKRRGKAPLPIYFCILSFIISGMTWEGYKNLHFFSLIQSRQKLYWE